MADNQGTEEDEWFLVSEADCVDGEDSMEELFDQDTDSNISDLIDDSVQAQGNSLELFHAQESFESQRQECNLKRKCFGTPEQEIEGLSPRLSAVKISHHKGNVAKKRLFEDSGVENEASGSVGEADKVDDAKRTADILEVLKCKNRLAKLNYKFKDKYGVAWSEITRPYHSPKTCGKDWVVYVHGAHATLIESGKTVIREWCDFLLYYEIGFSVLMLCSFKSQKCRDTILNQMAPAFCVDKLLIMAEPPKLSIAAALFWFRLRVGYRDIFSTGEMPEWIVTRTAVTKQLEAEKPFLLLEMVQWAYDNKITEECELAYEYAMLANEDANAMAYLKSNNQAKITRDCAYMVKQYFRAEMNKASMSTWIHNRMKRISGEGNWREICRFLKFQHVSLYRFEECLRNLLAGKPKKSCLVLQGPSDTGKSYFANSLIRFLGGKVLSFANSHSHFWLSPLADAKVALIDDATMTCWNYMDVNLRSALDGSPICVDCKNKQPMQIKCPPLIITTNVDLEEKESFKHLRTRLTVFQFHETFPFDADGNPGYGLNDPNWKEYFGRFWQQLDLSDQEEEGEEDGESSNPLRLCPR
uniref:Replication protein E1 n=1 Tax=Mops bat papillomavirus TaxID=3141892 RepID=A0AAU7E3K2_9PAPI